MNSLCSCLARYLAWVSHFVGGQSLGIVVLLVTLMFQVLIRAQVPCVACAFVYLGQLRAFKKVLAEGGVELMPIPRP